jgi:hypothetical protein
MLRLLFVSDAPPKAGPAVTGHTVGSDSHQAAPLFVVAVLLLCLLMLLSLGSWVLVPSQPARASCHFLLSWCCHCGALSTVVYGTLGQAVVYMSSSVNLCFASECAAQHPQPRQRAKPITGCPLPLNNTPKSRAGVLTAHSGTRLLLS